MGSSIDDPIDSCWPDFPEEPQEGSKPIGVLGTPIEPRTVVQLHLEFWSTLILGPTVENTLNRLMPREVLGPDFRANFARALTRYPIRPALDVSPLKGALLATLAFIETFPVGAILTIRDYPRGCLIWTLSSTIDGQRRELTVACPETHAESLPRVLLNRLSDRGGVDPHTLASILQAM